MSPLSMLKGKQQDDGFFYYTVTGILMMLGNIIPQRAK
jgi:hypothetical protein